MSFEHQEEEALGKVYDRRLMRRLLRYLSPYKLTVAVSFVLVLAVSALKLVAPFLTKIAIDDYIAVGDLAGLSRIALVYSSSRSCSSSSSPTSRSTS